MRNKLKLRWFAGSLVMGAIVLAGCANENSSTPAGLPSAAPPPPSAGLSQQDQGAQRSPQGAPSVTNNSSAGMAPAAPVPQVPPASAAPPPPVQQPATTAPSENNMQTNVLHVGADAPDFSLESNMGGVINLSSYQDSQIVVLYFYPKAGTPGCTKEACAFRDAIASYKGANVAVLGISPDPVPLINKFTNDYHLNFPLLADTDHKIAEEYGVWQEKLGKDGTMKWGAARTTFVIGKDGKILHVFEKVNPEGHDQLVLEWLKENALRS